MSAVASTLHTEHPLERPCQQCTPGGLSGRVTAGADRHLSLAPQSQQSWHTCCTRTSPTMPAELSTPRSRAQIWCLGWSYRSCSPLPEM